MVHLSSKRTADKLSDRSLVKVVEIVKFTLRYLQWPSFRDDKSPAERSNVERASSVPIAGGSAQL